MTDVIIVGSEGVDWYSGEPWPFTSGSVGSLEHPAIDRVPPGRVALGTEVAESSSRGLVPYRVTQDLFFWVFDEAARVLKPGGTFRIAWSSPCARPIDPTVYRRLSLSTLNVLSSEGRRKLGITERMKSRWRVLTLTGGHHPFALLEVEPPEPLELRPPGFIALENARYEHDEPPPTFRSCP